MRELELRPGQDGLEVLLQHLDRPSADQAECVKAFWQEVRLISVQKLAKIHDTMTDITPSSVTYLRLPHSVHQHRQRDTPVLPPIT